MCRPLTPPTHLPFLPCISCDGLPHANGAAAPTHTPNTYIRTRIDPFGPDSLLRETSVSSFPRDLFFVLRVTQLLRGMANGMGLADFSSASQWRPWAAQALADAKAGRRPVEVEL